MLDKMGYKTGMGLGAEGNKGIMAPFIAGICRAWGREV